MSFNADESKPNEQGNASDLLQSWGLGIVGAVAGGALGWFIFGWFLEQGFHALALPGALIGLGFGYSARKPMVAGGVFCAAAAFLLTVLCEWSHRPFIADESLGFFISHLHEVSPASLLMGTLGVVFAFWFGKGR